MSGNQSPPHATQTFIAVAELIARGCYVVRSLHDWIRDHDRWPDLCGAPASRAHTLDCGGRHRNDRTRDSDGREGHPSEGPPGTVAAGWRSPAQKRSYPAQVIDKSFLLKVALFVCPGPQDR